MPRLVLNRFGGGLNLRDSPNELAPNEAPFSADWTLDRRGAIQWRNGCLNAASLPGVSGKFAYIFYSEVLDQWLCARETAGAPNNFRLFTRPGDLSGVWTDRGQIASAVGARAVFADWPGAPSYCLIATDIADVSNGGIYTWDGTTLTRRSTTPIRAIAVWQNKVWEATTVTGLGTRLSRSAAGDPTTWGDFTDIRDKDAAAITALGLAGGALIAFKQRSAYRVNDSATGAYTMIDASAGCQGPSSIVALRGRLYAWGTDGLYEWNGIGPGKNVGDKARPYFITPILSSEPPVGGVVDGKALFCFANDFGTVRDDLLEFHPEAGWLMYHKLASTAKDEISSFSPKGNALYAALYDGDVMFRMFTETPGADDGTLAAFAGRNTYRTAWLEPMQGKLCRIERAAVEGLLAFGGTTTLVLNVYKDGDLSVSDQYDLSADLRAPNANDQVQTSIIHALGHARSFAFEFVAATAAGAAQINSLILDYIPLEG